MINLVIAFSQQTNNKCAMGDTEQDHCALIAQNLYDILKSYPGFDLYLMPKFPTDSVRKTVELSNAFINGNGGQGYHIEIHTDAGAYARGCSGLYYSEGGLCFVKPIIEELERLTPWKDVGLRHRENLSALKNTVAIAGLVEVSFHDNPEEAKWIHDNIFSIASAIARGILRQFNISLEIKEVSKALEVLKSNGITNNPDYWLAVLNGTTQINLQYLSQLLINVANKVR